MNIKINKNYLFYDLETTGLDTSSCVPLEFSFFVSKDDLKTFRSCKFKVQFNKPFCECSPSEKSGLIFNKIHNQTDLDIHNSTSLPLSVVLKKFIYFVENFFSFKEFYLIGYNNFNYDNLILNRLLNFYFPDKSYYIFQNSYDVFSFIKNSKNYSHIGSLAWHTSFNPNDCRLLSMYQHIFKKSFQAHDSYEDVKATVLLFKYYKKNLSELLFSEMENTFYGFLIDDNLILKKNEVKFQDATFC